MRTADASLPLRDDRPRQAAAAAVFRAALSRCASGGGCPTLGVSASLTRTAARASLVLPDGPHHPTLQAEHWRRAAGGASSSRTTLWEGPGDRAGGLVSAGRPVHDQPSKPGGRPGGDPWAGGPPPQTASTSRSGAGWWCGEATRWSSAALTREDTSRGAGVCVLAHGYMWPPTRRRDGCGNTGQGVVAVRAIPRKRGSAALAYQTRERRRRRAPPLAHAGTVAAR